MAMIRHPGVEEIIRLFADLGRLRVWSVVVTIFGDHVQSPQDSISAEDLRRLTGRIGIRPDALRVAVHRLGKDGWITASRIGRNSHYRLTSRAFAESQAARPRIYARRPAINCEPVLVVTAPQCRTLTQGPRAELFRQVAPRNFIGCRKDLGRLSDSAVLPFGEAPVPDWIRHQLGPPELGESYAKLAVALEKMQEALDNSDFIESEDSDVFRVLAIHRWRQLLLRHLDLPERFFPDGWCGEICRERVQKILTRTPCLGLG